VKSSAEEVGAQSVFVARQAILGPDRGVIGYELLYRDGWTGVAQIDNHSQATADVIVNALGVIGIAGVSGGHALFINLGDADFFDEVAEVLPPDRVVLEILETMSPSDDLYERCTEWKAMGYRLALDDFVYSSEWEPYLDLVSFVKLDVRQLDRKALIEHAALLKGRELQIVAEKVESPDEFEFCSELGCDAFQGYFFARSEILTEETLPVSTMALLDALQRLHRDEDLPDIERALTRDAGLLHRLLRFASSVAFGARPPEHLRSALTRLGRRNLQRWLMLELYVSSKLDPKQAEALFDLASHRAELMAALAKASGDGSVQDDEAAAVGALSLLEALLQRPMERILEGLALPETISAALVERTGPLGDMLALIGALEQADEPNIARLSAQLNIDLDELPGLQSRAFEAHIQIMQAFRQSRQH
jgi:c-di-GMP phosphodiesterase